MLVVRHFLIVGLKLTELGGNLSYFWGPIVGTVVICVVCLPLGSLLSHFSVSVAQLRWSCVSLVP